MPGLFSQIKEKYRRRFKPTLEEQVEDAQTKVETLDKKVTKALGRVRETAGTWDREGPQSDLYWGLQAAKKRAYDSCSFS